MKILTLAFLVIILASCGNEAVIPEEFANHSVHDIEGARNTKKVSVYSEDRFLESGMLVNGVRQGPWITYHRKSYKPHFITNYKDGVLEGNYNEFNEGGELKIHAFLVNGEFEGEYKEYLKGTLIKKQHFVNGKIEGAVMNYYPETGMRMSSLNYIDGIQDGISTYYNENGLPYLEYTYENGEQVSSKDIPIE